jgi:Transposase DNA-binding/Transposase Tn5 dimerisation domain
MRWYEEEFETIDLGDKRLNKRVMHIVENLGLAPGRTIPQSFKTWGEIKACYNFFSNDLVSEQKLLAPHLEKTIERIREYSVVLLISDTTDINYTTKEAMKGKERLDNKQNGIWLHPTIAVTPERLNLGIVDANFWHRQPEVAEKNSASRTVRDKAPIEEKESYRWLQSYLKACEIARDAPETQIINITDREGDIIEIFETAHEQTKEGSFAYFIVRSQYNRCLKEKDEESNKIQKKLRQRLNETASLGEVEFTIHATEKRKGRKVKQQLKACTVTLKPGNKYKKSKEVRVNAVMAIEENQPEGEEPLVWVFITNLPIRTFDDICKVIKYYLCRWEIEIFFKVLKSGCKIEERQLETADRMKNLISIFMMLAWRVQFTMILGRVCSEISSGEVFEAAEWKSVYKIVNNKKTLPRKPPRLGEFIIMVAILGGYVNKKGAEPPGIKTMWKGMARMVDFAIAWEAFGK